MKKTRNEKKRKNAALKPKGSFPEAHPWRIRGMKDKLSDLLVVECVTKPAGKKS